MRCLLLLCAAQPPNHPTTQPTTQYSTDTKLVDVRTGRVRQSTHQRLTCYERLDLRAYPYDRHTLSVVFRSEHSAHELELSANKRIESTVECFGLSEFVLAPSGSHKTVHELHCEAFEMNSELLDGLRHSELVCAYVCRCRCRCRRRRLCLCVLLLLLRAAAYRLSPIASLSLSLSLCSCNEKRKGRDTLTLLVWWVDT
jgi:hypothetical protein